MPCSKDRCRVFGFTWLQRQAGVDRLAFSVGDVNGGGTTAQALSTTPVVVGQFYHVVGTYDGSFVRLYVDGVLEAQLRYP